MRYLLVILEDETTVRPDDELFAYEEDAPDPRNIAACVDRLFDVCDQDALGKRVVMELEPSHYSEAKGSTSEDLQTNFNFGIQGHLQ